MSAPSNKQSLVRRLINKAIGPPRTSQSPAAPVAPAGYNHKRMYRGVEIPGSADPSAPLGKDESAASLSASQSISEQLNGDTRAHLNGHTVTDFTNETSALDTAHHPRRMYRGVEMADVAKTEVAPKAGIMYRGIEVLQPSEADELPARSRSVLPDDVLADINGDIDGAIDGKRADAPPVATTDNQHTVRKSPPSKTNLRPLDITVPDEISRYTIGAKIGSGTCGVVHLALDNVLRREVAVKLSPIGEPHISTGKVPGAQRAYQTEIVAAGRLQHPNIVTVYDAGQYEELNYLVMEAIQGESLKEYGKGQKPLPVYRAIEVIIDCCAALDYSHAQGILHRDIKPANIMVGEDASVKLLDFGIAVGLSGLDGLSKQGPTLGTPNYMSPEQILGRELGPASDLYSLTTVLFELLTGRQLFKARKVKDLFRTVVHKAAPKLHDIRPDLPIELSDVLAKALRKKPELRYQSGSELASALKPFIERFRIVEQRPPAQQRFTRRLLGQSFFHNFTDVEVALLLEQVKVKSYDAGVVMRASGDEDKRLMIVTDGVVKVMRNETFMRVCGEGECVGEQGFINGEPEHEDMVALTSVNALEVTTEALGELPPKVHLHYYRAISEVPLARKARNTDTLPDFSL